MDQSLFDNLIEKLEKSQSVCVCEGEQREEKEIVLSQIEIIKFIQQNILNPNINYSHFTIPDDYQKNFNYCYKKSQQLIFNEDGNTCSSVFYIQANYIENDTLNEKRDQLKADLSQYFSQYLESFFIDGIQIEIEDPVSMSDERMSIVMDRLYCKSIIFPIKITVDLSKLFLIDVFFAHVNNDYDDFTLLPIKNNKTPFVDAFLMDFNYNDDDLLISSLLNEDQVELYADHYRFYFWAKKVLNIPLGDDNFDGREAFFHFMLDENRCIHQFNVSIDLIKDGNVVKTFNGKKQINEDREVNELLMFWMGENTPNDAFIVSYGEFEELPENEIINYFEVE